MVTIAAAVGLLTSLATCGVAARFLRRLGILDVPNARSSHGRPTVRGAGVGVLCGTVVGALVAIGVSGHSPWPWRATSIVLIAAVSMAALGLADDLRSGVSFRIRLLGQAVVATGAVIALGRGQTIWPWSIVLACGGVVGIVGYVNAFNFMDGINGISGVTGLVAGAAFAEVGNLKGLGLLEVGGAALAAACLGFLPFNVPQARAFLGDVGSYFIGAWIALLAYVAAAAGLPLDVVFAPLALYVADVAITLATRVRRGDEWHVAHRDHAYQRLVAAGWSHMSTTLLVLIVSLGLAALGLASLQLPAWRGAIWPAMAVLLAAYLAAPTLLMRHQSERGRPPPTGASQPVSPPAPDGASMEPGSS